jgi:hypothetical protein
MHLDTIARALRRSREAALGAAGRARPQGGWASGYGSPARLSKAVGAGVFVSWAGRLSQLGGATGPLTIVGLDEVEQLLLQPRLLADVVEQAHPELRAVAPPLVLHARQPRHGVPIAPSQRRTATPPASPHTHRPAAPHTTGVRSSGGAPRVAQTRGQTSNKQQATSPPPPSRPKSLTWTWRAKAERDCMERSSTISIGGL